MDLGLRDAVVLVTGSSRGIGKAIALAFAKEGARVAICGRDRNALDSTAQEIRATKAECLTLAADLLAAENCTKIVEETVAHFGTLNVLVNNASAVTDTTPHSLEAATDSQILARVMGKAMPAIRISRAAIPHMREDGGGRIVCIGGTAARELFRVPGASSILAQGLGNSAIVNFAKNLADEVAHDGILVNVVHPHVTRTDRHPSRIKQYAADLGVSIDEAEKRFVAQYPIGRVVEPDDIAPIVLLLASRLASAITGQTIAVDGGALRNIVY